MSSYPLILREVADVFVRVGAVFGLEHERDLVLASGDHGDHRIFENLFDLLADEPSGDGHEFFFAERRDLFADFGWSEHGALGNG